MQLFLCAWLAPLSSQTQSSLNGKEIVNLSPAFPTDFPIMREHFLQEHKLQVVPLHNAMHI